MRIVKINSQIVKKKNVKRLCVSKFDKIISPLSVYGNDSV